nr:uncharacterized protein LOC129266752 [Lytechinus pictus]
MDDGETLASVLREGMMAELGDDELQINELRPMLPLLVPEPASPSQLLELSPINENGQMENDNDDILEVHNTSVEVDEVSTIEERHGEVVEEVELEDEDKTTRAMGYITDPTQRRKRLSARKKTLLEKAKEICIMCGAKVDLEIKTESGRQYSYHSHPITRSVKLQAGSSTLETRTSSRPTFHTPTKRRETPQRPKPGNVAGPSSPQKRLSAPVQGLPGKKKKQMSKRAREEPAQNKCKICRIMYDSKKDKELQKKKGASASWIGCDVEVCDYWGHACCIGIKVKDRRSAQKIPFKCTEHQ